MSNTTEQNIVDTLEWGHDENGELLIMTTADPVQDLKMLVQALHHDMPPVEVIGAMLCNVIGMLEGTAPDIVMRDVGMTPKLYME